MHFLLVFLSIGFLTFPTMLLAHPTKVFANEENVDMEALEPEEAISEEAISEEAISEEEHIGNEKKIKIVWRISRTGTYEKIYDTLYHKRKESQIEKNRTIKATSKLLIESLESSSISLQSDALIFIYRYKFSTPDIFKKLTEMFPQAPLPIKRKIKFIFQYNIHIFFKNLYHKSLKIRQQAVEQFMKDYYHSKQAFVVYLLVDFIINESNLFLQKRVIKYLNKYIEDFMPSIDDELLIKKVLRSHLLSSKSSMIKVTVLSILSRATHLSKPLHDEACIRVANTLSDSSEVVRKVGMHTLVKLKPTDAPSLWPLVDVVFDESDFATRHKVLDMLINLKEFNFGIIRKLSFIATSDPTPSVRLKALQVIGVLGKKLARREDYDFVANKLKVSAMDNKNPEIRVQSVQVLHTLRASVIANIKARKAEAQAKANGNGVKGNGVKVAEHSNNDHVQEERQVNKTGPAQTFPMAIIVKEEDSCQKAF